MMVSVPSPFGAVILKAAAYQSDSRDKERHLQDAALLRTVIEDPYLEREQFTGSDRSRLQSLVRALPVDAREWRLLPAQWRADGQAALRISRHDSLSRAHAGPVTVFTPRVIGAPGSRASGTVQPPITRVLPTLRLACTDARSGRSRPTRPGHRLPTGVRSGQDRPAPAIRAHRAPTSTPATPRRRASPQVTGLQSPNGRSAENRKVGGSTPTLATDMGR